MRTEPVFGRLLHEAPAADAPGNAGTPRSAAYTPPAASAGASGLLDGLRLVGSVRVGEDRYRRGDETRLGQALAALPSATASSEVARLVRYGTLAPVPAEPEPAEPEPAADVSTPPAVASDEGQTPPVQSTDDASARSELDRYIVAETSPDSEKSSKPRRRARQGEA